MTELRPVPASPADFLPGQSVSVSAEAVDGPAWLRMPPFFALPALASGPALEVRASDLGTVATPAMPNPGDEDRERVGEGAIPAAPEGESELLDEATTARPAVGTVLVPEQGVTSPKEAKAAVGQLPAVRLEATPVPARTATRRGHSQIDPSSAETAEGEEFQSGQAAARAFRTDEEIRVAQVRSGTVEPAVSATVVVPLIANPVPVPPLIHSISRGVDGSTLDQAASNAGAAVVSPDPAKSDPVPAGAVPVASPTHSSTRSGTLPAEMLAAVSPGRPPTAGSRTPPVAVSSAGAASGNVEPLSTAATTSEPVANASSSSIPARPANPLRATIVPARVATTDEEQRASTEDLSALESDEISQAARMVLNPSGAPRSAAVPKASDRASTPVPVAVEEFPSERVAGTAQMTSGPSAPAPRSTTSPGEPGLDRSSGQIRLATPRPQPTTPPDAGQNLASRTQVQGARAADSSGSERSSTQATVSRGATVQVNSISTASPATEVRRGAESAMISSSAQLSEPRARFEGGRMAAARPSSQQPIPAAPVEPAGIEANRERAGVPIESAPPVAAADHSTPPRRHGINHAPESSESNFAPTPHRPHEQEPARATAYFEPNRRLPGLISGQVAVIPPASATDARVVPSIGQSVVTSRPLGNDARVNSPTGAPSPSTSASRATPESIKDEAATGRGSSPAPGRQSTDDRRPAVASEPGNVPSSPSVVRAEVRRAGDPVVTEPNPAIPARAEPDARPTRQKVEPESASVRPDALLANPSSIAIARAGAASPTVGSPAIPSTQPPTGIQSDSARGIQGAGPADRTLDHSTVGGSSPVASTVGEQQAATVQATGKNIPVDSRAPSSIKTEYVSEPVINENLNHDNLTGPQRDPTHGTPAAKQVAESRMLMETDNTNRTGEQVLPAGVVFESAPATERRENLGRADLEPPRAGAEVGAGSVQDVDRPLEGGELTEATHRVSSTDRLERLIDDVACRVKVQGNDSVSVTFRPNASTEVRIEVRRGDDGLFAALTLVEGDPGKIGIDWTQLQDRLGRQGVRVEMDQALSAHTGGHHEQSPRKPFDQPEETPMLPRFFNGPAPRDNRPSRASSTRGESWEFWA